MFVSIHTEILSSNAMLGVTTNRASKKIQKESQKKEMIIHETVEAVEFTFAKCSACPFLASSFDNYGGTQEQENACAKCAARFVQRKPSETVM